MRWNDQDQWLWCDAPAHPPIIDEETFRQAAEVQAVRRAAPASAAPAAGTAVPEPPAELNGHGHAALDVFAADISAGTVPGIGESARI